jgi:hypothetical protein
LRDALIEVSRDVAARGLIDRALEIVREITSKFTPSKT